MPIEKRADGFVDIAVELVAAGFEFQRHAFALGGQCLYLVFT